MNYELMEYYYSIYIKFSMRHTIKIYINSPNSAVGHRNKLNGYLEIT